MWHCQNKRYWQERDKSIDGLLQIDSRCHHVGQQTLQIFGSHTLSQRNVTTKEKLLDTMEIYTHIHTHKKMIG